MNGSTLIDTVPTESPRIRHRLRVHSRIPQQGRLWCSPSPYLLYLGGRGSGKTYGGAIWAFSRPRKQAGLIVAPTHKNLLGGAMAVEHRCAGYRDYAKIAAAQSGPRAFADAGVTHADIDLAMLYDSFTITVLTTLEGLGFCGFGEGGAFVSSKNLRLDGDFPLNTDGGGLSSNHPGARGIFLVMEATRQLRGNEGPRQVKDCRTALCHGTGFSLGTQHSGATIILAKD